MSLSRVPFAAKGELMPPAVFEVAGPVLFWLFMLLSLAVFGWIAYRDHRSDHHPRRGGAPDPPPSEHHEGPEDPG